MQIGLATRIFGCIYIVVGVFGFIAPLAHPVSDAPHAIGGTNLLFGLFAVNTVHNLVHIAIGLLGLLVAGSAGMARVYWQTVAVLFWLLTVLGLFSATQTLFGLAPLHGNDVWLHALTAALATYFGWFTERTAPANS